MADWTRVSTWVVLLLVLAAGVVFVALFFGPIGPKVGPGIGTELLQ